MECWSLITEKLLINIQICFNFPKHGPIVKYRHFVGYISIQYILYILSLLAGRSREGCSESEGGGG